MADAPDKAIADILAGAGLGLTLGTNLFRGPVRQQSITVPHKAVFCLSTGGPSAINFVQANTGPDIKRSTVQVRVRSDVGDFSTGQTLATAVWTALQRAVIIGYMSCTVRESEPVYLGVDDTEHHGWSLNIITMREE